MTAHPIVANKGCIPSATEKALVQAYCMLVQNGKTEQAREGVWQAFEHFVKTAAEKLDMTEREKDTATVRIFYQAREMEKQSKKIVKRLNKGKLGGQDVMIEAAILYPNSEQEKKLLLEIQACPSLARRDEILELQKNFLDEGKNIRVIGEMLKEVNGGLVKLFVDQVYGMWTVILKRFRLEACGRKNQDVIVLECRNEWDYLVQSELIVDNLWIPFVNFLLSDCDRSVCVNEFSAKINACKQIESFSKAVQQSWDVDTIKHGSKKAHRDTNFQRVSDTFKRAPIPARLAYVEIVRRLNNLLWELQRGDCEVATQSGEDNGAQLFHNDRIRMYYIAGAILRKLLVRGERYKDNNNTRDAVCGIVSCWCLSDDAVRSLRMDGEEENTGDSPLACFSDAERRYLGEAVGKVMQYEFTHGRLLYASLPFLELVECLEKVFRTVLVEDNILLLSHFTITNTIEEAVQDNADYAQARAKLFEIAYEKRRTSIKTKKELEATAESFEELLQYVSSWWIQYYINVKTNAFVDRYNEKVQGKSYSDNSNTGSLRNNLRSTVKKDENI